MSFEFNSYVKNGFIAVPSRYRSQMPKEIYVIVKPKQENRNDEIGNRLKVFKRLSGSLKNCDVSLKKAKKSRLAKQ